MADDWSLILVDLDGTPIADLTAEAQDITATFRMRDQHELTWTVDGASQLARDTRELLTDVIVMWRGQRLARLRVAQSSDDIGPEGHSATFSAIDYRGMLARRFTRGVRNWSGDTAQIVWELIDWSQTSAAGGGDWGIRRGTLPAIGTVTDYEVPEARQLKELFAELSEETYPGFDWEIDADLVYRVWSFRGSRREFALEWGGNVIGVQRDADPSIYANYVRYSGAEGIPSAWRSAPDIASRPEGRFEMAEGNPDLTNTVMVGRAADALLQRHGTFLPGYQMSLEPGTWDPSQLWLGDSGSIVVRSGRLDVHDVERVFEIAVSLDPNGVSGVELTFGILREDLLALVRAVPERLDRLYRR